MRRSLLWVWVLVLAVAAPGVTDAGGKAKKKRKPEAFTLVARDAHETRGGVNVRLDERGRGWRADGNEIATWVLVASQDGAFHEAYFTSDEPWAELDAFGSLFQAVPADGGVRVTVRPAVTDAVPDADLEARVIAEAAKRRIAHVGIGMIKRAGVARVMLGGDGFRAVDARVGTYSGSILGFHVDPYAAITPPLLKGAKKTPLVRDAEVEIAGLGVTATADGLIVRKGKKTKLVPAGWAEAVMFARVLWVRGDELIVTTSKQARPKKHGITTTKAIALVKAEADLRDIAYDRASSIAHSDNGLLEVTLSLGKTKIVSALLGTHTRKFLAYDVTPPGRTQVPVTPSRDPTPDTGRDIGAGMTKVLDEHNRYRAKHCAPALTWSDELAAAAQAWAERLRDAGCQFEHSSTKYGENLAAGTPGHLPPEDVVGMWYDEIADYDFASGKFEMSTGHFTQVVWKSSKRLGCGMVSDCNGMDIWVCQYDPPGNYGDQYDANVLPMTCK